VQSAEVQVTSTPAKLAVFTAAGQHTSSSDGDQSVAPVLASNKLQVVERGIYLVMFSGSMWMGAVRELDLYLYVDGVKQTGIGARLSGNGAQKRQAVSFQGVLSLTGSPANGTQLVAGKCDLELWASTVYDDGTGDVGGAGADLNFDIAQFTALRLY